VLYELAELFSRLFYVAASRLNSPRFQWSLYAVSERAVNHACKTEVS
jgi:hypothetical protein